MSSECNTRTHTEVLGSSLKAEDRSDCLKGLMARADMSCRVLTSYRDVSRSYRMASVGVVDEGGRGGESNSVPQEQMKCSS